MVRRVDLQIILHELVNFHYCCLVAASIAVVGRRKDRDHVPLVRPVVSVHDQLMRTRDPRQAIRVVKLLRNVLTETITSAAWTDAPTAPVVGVRPEQIADGSLVRRLLHSVKLADLVQRVDAGRETSV